MDHVTACCTISHQNLKKTLWNWVSKTWRICLTVLSLGLLCLLPEKVCCCVSHRGGNACGGWSCERLPPLRAWIGCIDPVGFVRIVDRHANVWNVSFSASVCMSSVRLSVCLSVCVSVCLLVCLYLSLVCRSDWLIVVVGFDTLHRYSTDTLWLITTAHH